MGLFNSIGDFFGGGDISDSISQQQSASMAMWNKTLKWIKDEYASTASEYTRNYQGTLADYDSRISQARESMSEGFGRELEYLGTGKENTLNQVQQQYQQMQGQTLASNITSGLAGTSFGQGQVQSVQREQAQQLGNVETAYAQQFAGTEARHRQERSALDTFNISGRTQLQTGYQTGMANLRGSWADRVSNSQSRGLTMQQGYGQQHIGQAQANVAVGQNIMGNILGGLF